MKEKRSVHHGKLSQLNQLDEQPSTIRLFLQYYHFINSERGLRARMVLAVSSEEGNFRFWVISQGSPQIDPPVTYFTLDACVSSQNQTRDLGLKGKCANYYQNHSCHFQSKPFNYFSFYSQDIFYLYIFIYFSWNKKH